MALEFTGMYHRYVTNDEKGKKVRGKVITTPSIVMTSKGPVKGPYQPCKIYREAFVDRSKYTGEILRELRATRGIGSIKEFGRRMYDS